MSHFQQAQFQMEALLLLVPQLAVRAQHDLQMARQIFFAEQFGNARDAFALFAGNLQQARILARDLGDGRVAQKANHLPGEVRGTVPLADEVVNLAKDFFALALGYRLHHLLENVRGSGADQIAD